MEHAPVCARSHLVLGACDGAGVRASFSARTTARSKREYTPAFLSTTDGEMNHNRSMSRRSNRPQFHVEPLEARQLLSVDFSTGTYTVSDRAGAASITLLNSPDGIASTTPPPAQVNLSFGGGTAVPGVDYTPGNQTVSFAAGQGSETVQIPVLPGNPSEGTRVVEIDLSPAPGSQPTSAAFLIITHNADTTPPRVIATKMLTRGPYVTGFVITFSKDMAPGPVQDVSNYAIADPRSVRPVKGLQWTIATRQIALKSAIYNPTAHSVTLKTSGKVRTFPFFSIVDTPLYDVMNIVGQKTPPTAAQLLTKISPITDTTGNPLDGSGSGTADGQLFAIVTAGKPGNKLSKLLNPTSSSGL